MTLLAYLLLSALAFLGVASFTRVLKLEGRWTAVGAATVYGVLHVTIYKVLFWLTLPVTLLTFGLWIFVLNALMLALTSKLLRNFRIEGGWGALLLVAAVLTVIHALIRAIVF